MGGAIKWCVGKAGDLPGDVWRDLDAARERPEACMQKSDNRRDECDEAHQSNQVGLENFDTHPSPGWAVAAKQLAIM